MKHVTIIVQHTSRHSPPSPENAAPLNAAGQWKGRLRVVHIVREEMRQNPRADVMSGSRNITSDRTRRAES